MVNNEQIINVVNLTLSFFDLPATDGWRAVLYENKAETLSRFAVKINSNLLILFSESYNSQIKVELCNRMNFSYEKKKEWEQKVKALDNYAVTTFGNTRSGDVIIDIEYVAPFDYQDDNQTAESITDHAYMKKSSSDFKKSLHLDDTDAHDQHNHFISESLRSPEPVQRNKRRKCPNPDCSHTLTEDEINSEYCNKCEENFYLCPRCEDTMVEDPDYEDECPKCQQSLKEVDCPECSVANYVDSHKCKECSVEFTHSVCPHCQKKLIFNKDLDECPYCNENIWYCDNCKNYLADDPDDIDECPNCHCSTKKITCPECEEEIPADTKDECPKCHAGLKLSTCPDCDHSLVLSAKLDDCPYCGTTLWVCPVCKDYIDEDPEDAEECPRCKASLVTDSCPECGADILATSNICPKCNAKLAQADCPHEDCGGKIIVNDDTEECPYCHENIKLVSCPKCDDKFYVEN